MTIIGAIMDKVMRRGLYKAYVNDQLITMCQDCRYNIREHNPIPGLKDLIVHRCEMTVGTDGNKQTLIDPYSIPAWCPFKVIEIEGAKAQ